MNVSELLALLSGVAALAAYASYGERMHRGRVVPNAATWLIWLVLGVINAATYIATTKGKLHQTIIVFTVTGCIAVIFAYTLAVGKFSYPSAIDAVCLAAATVVIGLWMATGSPRLANLLLQIIYITSYVPTIAMLLGRKQHESSTPWILASIAYGFATLAVLADYSGDWLSLSYPLVCGVAANSIMAVLAHKCNLITETSKSEPL